MNLVVIEGVGKKDTIKKYLGKDYEVIATKGHIRDLPVKSLGVNINDNFKPQYEIMPDKHNIVKELRAEKNKVDKIYLATDPDREGEAISWHLCHVLDLDPKDNVRIEFNEISKNAVTEALKKPRPIDLKLVDAQQARRVVDRLVGYKVSPILCKKMQPNLSAGRVQSVALKLIVDREREIQNFKPEEYWTLNANLFKDTIDDKFKTTLIKINGKKQNITSKEEMDKALEILRAGNFVVSNIKKAVSKVHPSAPYTTSSMQQEATNKLNMTLKKVSSCAQELYEGVNIGQEGKVALITYIRTDSVRVSPQAMEMAKNYIGEHFGQEYLPKTPNVYKVKKSAQDAHEAIRPISLDRTPESVKEYLSPDNYRLYKLIYNKFLASQMADAIYDTLTVEIDNQQYTFKASGRTLVFDGFTKMYNLTQTAKKKKETDAEDEDEEEENIKIPKLSENDLLTLVDLVPTQKFTKPPLRFTEATIVKEMEDKGIGRPATYTPTIVLLFNRKYIDKDGKYIVPTELGTKVTDMLEKYFSSIFNVTFTADMENKLDEIANDGLEWTSVIQKFYNFFAKILQNADKDATTYKEPAVETDEICEKCGGKMVIRKGKYGEFLACGNFPKCRNIRSLAKPVAVCPKCGGDVFERTSKKGDKYYACANRPTKCDFWSWERPSKDKCPLCGSYMTEKALHGHLRKKCTNPECNHIITVGDSTSDIPQQEN